MPGIRIVNQNGYSICYIENFTSDIKNALRKELASICYGPNKASSARKIYSYKYTLREFLNRYETKSYKMQLGMIGELLTHLLVIKFFSDFTAVTPYFNLEERSVKKGFDGVLYSRGKNELWITEVKSGELRKNKNTNETIISLLGTAKRDLQKRLNENNATFWENAINGAIVALENKSDIKEAVIDILSDIGDEVAEENAISTDKNVILVAGLFSRLSDQIEEREIHNYSQNINEGNIFRDVIIFSFQKETAQKVVDFLRAEAR